MINNRHILNTNPNKNHFTQSYGFYLFKVKNENIGGGTIMTHSDLSNLLLTSECTHSHEELLKEIKEYIIENILGHPLMQHEHNNISILIGGSTSLGVADHQSDVDIFVFCEDIHYEVIHHRYEDAGIIPTGSEFFVDFKLPSGKSGHYKLHRKTELTKGLNEGNMEWLWFSHVSYIVHDSLQIKKLFDKHVPMQSDLLYTLRKNTYIQLRTFAKALDNPVVRGERFPIHFFAVDVYKAALRCAIVVDGYPYPYDKWLVRVAGQLPVGKRVLECADDFFENLKAEDSYRPMFQEDNSFVKMEKRMRKILLEEFRSRDLDEPWLVEWWKYV